MGKYTNSIKVDNLNELVKSICTHKKVLQAIMVMKEYVSKLDVLFV